MNPIVNQKLENAQRMIGHTPMVGISYRYKGGEIRTIYAKVEFYNLSGSIKDRMALHIIKCAYECGSLKEGDTIVEATSGNTGIAFSALGAMLGHPVVIYMPDWMSSERKSLISSYGAEIRLISKEQGGFLGSIAQAENMAKEQPNVFLPRQFDNCDNCNAHTQSTAIEVTAQLATLGLTPDVMVAGVGTGGTIMGFNNYLRQKFPNSKVHPLEPSNSPTLRTGHKVGKHRMQGISDEFIPSIVELDRLDRIVDVDDGDSIIMAQMLAKKLGLAVGISSGGNLLGAIELKEENPDATVITVFADDNKKYLSTDYAKQELIKEGFVSPHIELISMDVIPCSTEICRNFKEL